jgi:myo-inositol-1(or 4)-monophosphatase
MPKDRKRAFLDRAVKAARLAGHVVLDNLGRVSKEDIDQKRASDFVTRVDRESEKIIIDTLRKAFPDHHFLAEESFKEPATDAYRWIIDPLDGTTNYIHQYPVFSLSIALEYKREIILGVVYDPLRKELFTAEKGNGAFLNKRPVKISPLHSLKHALVTTGFPFRNKESVDMYLELFKAVFQKISDLRRAGSAALDLAYLACGRCEGFFEIGLSTWDIAAGDILIREAGGIVTDFGGGNEHLKTGNIVAGNPAVHEQLLKEVKRVFGGIIDQ